MIIKILLTLISVAISAILYRFGGMSKEEAKKYHIPIFLVKSWIRDWLCPLFNFIVLLIWWRPAKLYDYLWFIPTYGFTGGAFSTYWDRLFNDKDNFYMHGFMIGLAAFPLYWAGIHWYAILANAIVCGGLMGILCSKTQNVWKEELGRGAIAATTRLLLLI